MKRDYYEVLGVDRNVSQSDLKKAFKRQEAVAVSVASMVDKEALDIAGRSKPVEKIGSRWV